MLFTFTVESISFDNLRNEAKDDDTLGVTNAPHFLLCGDQEGGDTQLDGALHLHSQATQTGGKRAIGGCCHPVARLAPTRWPGFDGEARVDHAEAQCVRRSSTRGKRSRGDDGGCAIDPPLDNQIRTIDVAFVEVIGIGPAQHRSKVGTTEATDRAGEEDFGIGSS